MITLTRLPSANLASSMGLELIDAAANRRCDALSHVEDLRVVAELKLGGLQFAAPLDIDRSPTINENIRYRRIAQERFDWAESDHFIDEARDEGVLLKLV